MVLFDNEVVCLGAGIHSTSQHPVFTTINQCLSSTENPIICQKGKLSDIQDGTTEYTSPEWILHNKIGYILPKGQQVFVANQQQEGNWYDINHTTSKDIIRKRYSHLELIMVLHLSRPLMLISLYLVSGQLKT